MGTYRIDFRESIVSINLDKLGKILALADGGATEEERDAFMRKAEELAAVLGVELAVARAAHADKSKREEPERRMVKVGNERSRYNAYMVELFIACAYPHDVRVTIGWRNIMCHGYGLPSDLAIVEAMFGVTAIQMVTDADKAIKAGAQRTADYGYPVDGRIYRANFYKGFISALESRLWRARESAIINNDREAGSTGTALVLRDKAKEVYDFYTESTKHISRRGGWQAPERDDYIATAVRQGSASAHATDLSLTNKVGTTKRGALQS